MNKILCYTLVLVIFFLFIVPMRLETRPENKESNPQTHTSNYCVCKSKPDYYVEVALKQVYVTVRSNDGLHIKDLKPEDFRLWEDSEEQTILAVDKVDFRKTERTSPEITTAGEAPMPSATTKPKRYFTILIGNLPELNAEREKSRSAIVNFVNEMIQPTDFISLYILTPTSLKLAVSFDLDPKKSRSAVLSYLQTEDFAGRGFRSTRRGRLGAADDENDIKNFEFLAITESLISLSKSLQYISGKKDVILFSEGVYFNPDISKEFVQGPDPIDVMKAKAGPSPATLMKKLASIKESFITNNISLQVIDLGKKADLSTEIGERMSSGGAGIAERENIRTVALHSISSSTGGKFYSYADSAKRINANLKSIDYETSFYYILSYTSNAVNDPGTYLPIKVEVLRDNATLAYKKGIIVPDDFENLDEKEQNAQLNYILQSSILYNMISMCSNVAILPRKDKNADIILGLQIPLDEIAVTNKKGPKFNLDIFLYIFNKNNEVVASFEKHIDISLINKIKKEKKNKLRMYYSTPMEEGEYRIRFFVRNRENMLISSEVFKINVPDFIRSELILGSPILYADFSDILAVNLNDMQKEKNETGSISSFPQLPGLHSISNETKNNKKIQIGITIKGLSKKEILSRENDFIKWETSKSIRDGFEKEPPYGIDYKVADIIEKQNGTFFTLFELDMRELQKGEYHTTIKISKGEKRASSSIDLHII